MKLEPTIIKALDLTGRLEVALDIGDLQLCSDLIEIRGAVMLEFENTHKACSPQERQQCAALVANLQNENSKLMVKYKRSLDASARDLRQAITAGSGTPIGAYKAQSSPACLDRKA